MYSPIHPVGFRQAPRGAVRPMYSTIVCCFDVFCGVGIWQAPQGAVRPTSLSIIFCSEDFLWMGTYDNDGGNVVRKDPKALYEDVMEDSVTSDTDAHSVLYQKLH